MKVRLILLMVAVIAVMMALHTPAQVSYQQIIYTSTTPSGSCSSTGIRLLTPNGTLYTCQNGTWGNAGSGNVTKVASGTLALNTTTVNTGTCGTAQTSAATGVLTTDAITITFNGDPTAVTGYTPATTGSLTIFVYPTADTVNAKVCNMTGSNITPGGAVTLNYFVGR